MDLASVDAASSWLHFTPGPPQGGGWVRLDELSETDGLQQIQRALHGHCDGMAAVEAAAIAGGVTYLLSWLLLAAPVLTGRRFQPAPRDLWVASDLEHAWLDRLAVDSAATATTVNPRHPAGIDVDRAVATLVTLVEPLVDCLAESRLLGRRALWGSVADAVSYQALAVADVAGLDVDAATAFGEALLAGMPASVQPPVWLTAWRDDTEQTIRLKQSCCLMYKTKQQGYCVTCPLSDEASRSAQIETWLANDPHESRTNGKSG